MDTKTEESRVNYNKIAKDYDNTFDGRFTRQFKSVLVDAAELRKGYKVLDVACGNGALLWDLYDKEKIEGYGVDISENMISTARSKYPDFTFTVADSDCLPFEDGSLDIITVSAAFHHFTKPEKFIMEAKRILKNGGKLYIAEVYFPPLMRQAANLILPFMKMGDVKIYNEKELIKFAKNAGYEEVSVIRVGKVNLLRAKNSNKTICIL